MNPYEQGFEAGLDAQELGLYHAGTAMGLNKHPSGSDAWREWNRGWKESL